MIAFISNLEVIRQLQVARNVTIERLALSRGYSGAAAFSDQCERLFRLRPSTARTFLGYEGVLVSYAGPDHGVSRT